MCVGSIKIFWGGGGGGGLYLKLVFYNNTFIFRWPPCVQEEIGGIVCDAVIQIIKLITTGFVQKWVWFREPVLEPAGWLVSTLTRSDR